MSGAPRQFILGLGSNLGEKAEIIAQAIRLLDQLPGARVLAVSEAVDSDPVGYADQPNFLNLCLAITCNLNPDELLSQTLEIERKFGRERTANRNGPRTLDIDLLFYEGGAWDSPSVTLPHPRWSSRGFVVIPLRQLLQHPLLAFNPEWRWLQDQLKAVHVSAKGIRSNPGSSN